MKLAGLFPGQGSQSVGMGREFFSTNEEARHIFAEADKALGFPLSDLCFAGPIEKLTLTKFAQPAILLVSYLAYKLSKIKVDAGAGHSLGEYTALVAAESLDLADALLLVHKRGSYMQEAVQPGQGKMMAVMGPTPEEINLAAAQISEGLVEAANFNSPGQTVVAGESAAIDAFASLIAAQGAKVIPLNVSAPFHCALMRPAQEKLLLDIKTIAISPPRFPVYANVTAAPHSSADEIRRLLTLQVTASVRWTDSMVNMLESEGITDAVEFGAGGVLTKLLKRINSSIRRHEISDPESLGKVNAVLA